MRGWSSLAAVAVLWLGSLAWLHHRYGPRSFDPETENDRETLNSLFDVQKEAEERGLLLFTPLELLRGPKSGPTTPAQRRLLKEARGRGGEPGEVEVGLYVTQWRRLSDRRAYLRSYIHVRLPRQASDSPLVKMLGDVDGSGVTNLRRDFGLVDFSSSWILRRWDLSLRTEGRRTGDFMQLKLTVLKGNHLLLKRKVKRKIGAAGSPAVEPSPFRPHRLTGVGDEWSAMVLEVNADSLASGETQLVRRRLRVVKRGTLRLRGREVSAYKVVMQPPEERTGTAARKGPEAWAWYSPDGRILKEHWTLLGKLAVTLVPLTPEELQEEQRKYLSGPSRPGDRKKGSSRPAPNGK